MDKFWFGSVPKECDSCGGELRAEFIDGSTSFGWARMCVKCHKAYGFGLGVGRGQRYIKQPDGKWLQSLVAPPKKLVL